MRASNFFWVDNIVLSYRTNQVYNVLQVLHLILGKLLHWNCQDSIIAMVFVLNFTCSIWFRPWCSYSVFITLWDQTYGGFQTTTKYSSTSIDAVVKGYLDQILIFTVVSSCWYSTYIFMENWVSLLRCGQCCRNVSQPCILSTIHKELGLNCQNGDQIHIAHLFRKLQQLGFLSRDCIPSDGNASFTHIMYLLHQTNNQKRFEIPWMGVLLSNNWQRFATTQFLALICKLPKSLL